MKTITVIAFVLVIIGGLNWLLVGFGWNLVDAIFGVGSTVSAIIYILVGISAIWLIFTRKGLCGNNSAPVTGQM